MTNAIQTATSTDAAIVERVVLNGDLANLTAAERVNYYGAVCKSVGLNPLTRPFEYITLNGKLTLYARKDATDQLRALRNISIRKPDIQFQDDLIIVSVEAHDANGRTDADVGVVKKSDMRGDVANALMKAITKAKRRVTLSICGLGMLDETEVETIPDARRPAPDVVVDAAPVVKPAPALGRFAQMAATLKATADQAEAIRTVYAELVEKLAEAGVKPYDTKPASLAEAISRCRDMAATVDGIEAK